MRRSEAGSCISLLPDHDKCLAGHTIPTMLIMLAISAALSWETALTLEGFRGVKDHARPELGGNVHHGDPFSFAPSAWTYLVRRFGIRSVMDLGCGEGHAASYFARVLGCETIAVDGLPKNMETAIYPIIIRDLQEGPVLAKVDMVHCVEMVEHLEEEFIENLLTTLCNGKILAMTHALPGQDGHHHVNCQPTEYWVQHLKKKGFELLVEETRRVKALAAEDGASYLAQSGLVFGRL